MLNSGTLLQNRYLIQAPLGQGGMGSVYRAFDQTMNRVVAIKEYIPDPNAASQAIAQARQQFQREAQVLGALTHPSLPHTYDFFTSGGNEYVVMELIEGQPLDQIIAQHGAINEGAVRAWANQVLDALIYIHSRNVIHRDIKPANIILKPDGKVVLVDFGLVKLVDPNNPYTATAMRGLGTAGYAPLEQFSAGMHTDARSDIYTLGATLYHLLSGQMPVDVPQRVADPNALPSLRAVNPNISPVMDAVVQKAMSVRAAERYQSAAEMRQALNTRPQPASTAPIYTPPSPIRPLVAAGGVVFLLIVCGIGLFLALNQVTVTPTPTTVALGTISPGQTPSTIVPTAIPVPATQTLALPSVTSTRIPTQAITPVPGCASGNLAGRVASDIPGTRICLDIPISSVIDNNTKPRDVYSIDLIVGQEVRFTSTDDPRLRFHLYNPSSTSIELGRVSEAWSVNQGYYVFVNLSQNFTPAVSGKYYLSVEATGTGQKYQLSVNLIK